MFYRDVSWKLETMHGDAMYPIEAGLMNQNAKLSLLKPGASVTSGKENIQTENRFYGEFIDVAETTSY